MSEIEVGNTYLIKKNWIQTPFLLNRITIKSRQQIENLSEYRDHLYVKMSSTDIQQAKKSVAFLKVVFDDIGKSNLFLNEHLTRAINNLILSILRNPGVEVELEKAMVKQSNLFRQSIRLLALSVSFGKEIGLKSERLQVLAKSAFLVDIGMLEHKSILDLRSSLSICERASISKHCEAGVKMLVKSKVEPAVIENVLCHHENIDGSGYPNGYKKHQLSIEARILRILNIYESLTGERSYRDKLSPEVAVNKLILLAKQGKLDPRLVEKFCHFVKVYPKNTFVLDYNNQQHRVFESICEDSLSTINLQSNLKDRISIYMIKSFKILQQTTPYSF